MLHRTIRLAFFCGTVLLAPSLLAQQKAPAEQLFWLGRDAMRDGDFEGACLAFEQSIGHQPSVGAFLNLALSEERLGRTAKALEHFQRVVSLTDPDDERHTLALDKIRELNAPPKETPPPASNQRDDAPAVAAHVVAPPAAAPQVTEAAAAPSQPPPRDETMTALGFVLAGAGATALGISAATGIVASGMKSDALAHCNGKFCDPQGLATAEQARWYAAVSTGTLVGGLLSIGVASFIFLQRNDRPTRDLAVGFSSSPTHKQLFVTGSL